METYRHASYRYSTGQGFNVNVDTPKVAEDVASFKMEPLMHDLGRPSFNVEVRREADRLSMQVEEAFRQMKNLGYDSEAGKRYRNLKARVEVLRHLMTSYSIEYIKAADLEKIYELYEKRTPLLEAEIKKIVDANRGASGVETYTATAKQIRRGAPVYDQFGKKLGRDDLEKFKKEGAINPFSGFGEGNTSKFLVVAGVLILAAVLIKFLVKKTVKSY